METIIKRHCIVREEPPKNPGWSANLGSDPQIIPGSNTNPKNKTPEVFHTVPEKLDGLEDITSSPFEKWHLFRCYWYLTLREGRFSCFFEPRRIHVSSPSPTFTIKFNHSCRWIYHTWILWELSWQSSLISYSSRLVVKSGVIFVASISWTEWTDETNQEMETFWKYMK